jgi:NADPH:quinone reductase
VNYRTDDLTARIAEITNGRGVDLVYHPVGGATAATALQSIVRNGRIAAIGLASGKTVPLDSTDMMRRNYSAVGVLAIPNDDPRVEAAVWDHLADLARRGAIATPVGTVYSFDQVPQMIAGQAAPAAGKSVVRVAG